MKFEYPWQDPEIYDDLRYLADKGLVLVQSYPSMSINFGVKIDGAQGPFPYVCPFDDEGMHVDLAGDDPDIVVRLQQESVAKAYQLGRSDGYREAQEQLKNKQALRQDGGEEL